MEEDQRHKETVSNLVGDSGLPLIRLCISQLCSQCQCTWFMDKLCLLRSERKGGVHFQTRTHMESPNSSKLLTLPVLLQSHC